ncbi:MAG: leucyl/phenylalanyl-tRNA--protein transferase [Ignavibacteria bacterium]|nr:leucyl/phenylalanyl-tRNA--protein transferase [Ignavibacteria bacterium]
MLNRFYTLSWENVLNGYVSGIFPMGNEDGTVSWFEADPRAVIPIAGEDDNLRISRSLRQVISRNEFEIRHNTAFGDVIRSCSKREYSWINDLIINAFTELNELGFGHSVEAWKEGKLEGGLYGVAFRGAFFGESMFYSSANASKVCVVRLFDVLKASRFRLFDIQMITPHFSRLGAVEISKEAYMIQLENAMAVDRKLLFDNHQNRKPNNICDDQ